MKTKIIEGDGPLSRVPPVAAFLVVVVVFAAGILIGGGVGALLLGLLAAGVAAMLAATWGALAPNQRFGRLLILALLVAVALSVLLAK
jgi:hypothetical protein